MLSDYLKSAARVLIAVVAAAFLSYALRFIVPFFGVEDHILVDLFTQTSEHFLLLCLVAIAATLGWKAIVKGPGGA
jgi:hypothetical protein